jgi:hypothetical protein
MNLKSNRFQQVMQWLQGGNHTFGVFLSEEKSRRLLEAFMPELVPKDCNADELLTDHQRLPNKCINNGEWL